MTTEDPDISDAFLVALTRISGILLGVFLSLSLSVIIFPKSASHQVRESFGSSCLPYKCGTGPSAAVGHVLICTAVLQL